LAKNITLPKPYSKSQRAEQISLIRDLIVFSIENKVFNRQILQREAEKSRILQRTDGGLFKYSSIYRYFDAFRFLKFDCSEQYNIEGDIEWSKSAYQLFKNWPQKYGNTLSEAEKKVLRGNIFQSEVKIQFLKHFCEHEVVPESEMDFITFGRPLYVINQSVKRPIHIQKKDEKWPDEWPATKNVEISRNPESGNVTRKTQVEFLHTYRYWCLDTDIIDELNIQEAERCGIKKPYSYVLYPINYNSIRTVEWFLNTLFETLDSENYKSRVVPIPWLMYKICPTYQLSVTIFKDLLLNTWLQYRNLIHLERGPGGLIEKMEYSSQDRSPRERYRNHRYYIIVDGTVRSNLAVLSSYQGR
jgi:hypothetical protein